MTSAASHDDEDEFDNERPGRRFAGDQALAVAVIWLMAGVFVGLAYLAPEKPRRAEPDVRMVDATPNGVTARHYVQPPVEGDRGRAATWEDLMNAYNLSPTQVNALMEDFDRRREATAPSVMSDPLPEGETLEISLR